MNINEFVRTDITYAWDAKGYTIRIYKDGGCVASVKNNSGQKSGMTFTEIGNECRSYVRELAQEYDADSVNEDSSIRN